MKANGADAAEKLVAAEPKAKPASMPEYLASVAPRMSQYLPKGMDADRFIRIAIRALIQNPKLAQCTKESIVIAVGQAAELGLEPNGALGFCALVPYNNNKTRKAEAKLLVMYKGLLQLMYRSGKFTVITADEVCENDLFEFEKGNHPFLKHKQAIKGPRGEPYAYYALYTTEQGGVDFQIMSREECLQWGRDYSRAFNDKDSPWQTAEAEMCKKTVLRKLAKYCPVQVDIPSEDFEEQPAEALKFANLIAPAEPKEIEAEPEQDPPAEQPKEETPAPAEVTPAPATAPSATGPAPAPAPQANAAPPKKDPVRRRTVAEMFQHEERKEPPKKPMPPAGTRYDPDTGEALEQPKAADQGALEIF